MPTPPSPYKGGFSWGKLRDWLNSLLAFCVASQPVSGFGVTVQDSAKGRAINAKGGSSSGAPTIFPWLVRNVNTSGGATVTRVHNGYVNDELGDSGMTEGDLDENQFTITLTGDLGYIWVEVDVAEGEASGFDVAFGADIPSDSDTKLYKGLASYAKPDGSETFEYSQIAFSNYYLYGCLISFSNPEEWGYTWAAV